MLVRVTLAIFLAAACRVCAQEALTDALPSLAEMIAQPIPESAWLDLRQTAPRNSKAQNAPAWVEALTLLPAETTETGGPSKSIFRIRVAQPGPEARPRASFASAWRNQDPSIRYSFSACSSTTK